MHVWIVTDPEGKFYDVFTSADLVKQSVTLTFSRSEHKPILVSENENEIVYDAAIVARRIEVSERVNHL